MYGKRRSLSILFLTLALALALSGCQRPVPKTPTEAIAATKAPTEAEPPATAIAKATTVTKATATPTLPPSEGQTQPTAKPVAPTPTLPTAPGDLVAYQATLPVALAHPQGWLVRETDQYVVTAPDADALAGLEIEGPALLVRYLSEVTDSDDLWAQLDLSDAVERQEREITLADGDVPGIDATLISPVSERAYTLHAAVLIREGEGLLIVATAPVERWQATEATLEVMLASVACR